MVQGFAMKSHDALEDDSHPTCPFVFDSTLHARAPGIFGHSERAAHRVLSSGSPLTSRATPFVERFPHCLPSPMQTRLGKKVVNATWQRTMS
ncbi:hypothetical protein RRSWK_00759 [Rhodopirellula sp. SWK7]|nr:hypothetical protein RRSWK_00759 [Rhodopirellula sp. SWK7]